jgi:5-(carboxyamino)imidazole ribonucleotide synthase
LGLPLGSTELKHYAVMCNILGPKNFFGRYKPITLEQKEGVFLKMYEKEEANPQRKMGHINVIDTKDTKDIEKLIRIAKQIRESIKFEF